MFEYGEVLYIKNLWPRRRIRFKFRVDPVPYIGQSYYRFRYWYKRPNMQKRERSLYYEYKEFVRDRRSPSYLPDPWDDEVRGDVRTRRSWKEKRIKRQWMKNI